MKNSRLFVKGKFERTTAVVRFFGQGLGQRCREQAGVSCSRKSGANPVRQRDRRVVFEFLMRGFVSRPEFARRIPEFQGARAVGSAVQQSDAGLQPLFNMRG